MKVIDLLNKIANGERFENCKMKFKEIEPEEISEYVIYDRLYEEDLTLNDEIELLEEDEFIEVVDLPISDLYLTENQQKRICEHINILNHNQKIIINKLKDSDIK